MKMRTMYLICIGSIAFAAGGYGLFAELFGRQLLPSGIWACSFCVGCGIILLSLGAVIAERPDQELSTEPKTQTTEVQVDLTLRRYIPEQVEVRLGRLEIISAGDPVTETIKLDGEELTGDATDLILERSWRSGGTPWTLQITQYVNVEPAKEQSNES